MMFVREEKAKVLDGEYFVLKILMWGVASKVLTEVSGLAATIIIRQQTEWQIQGMTD